MKTAMLFALTAVLPLLSLHLLLQHLSMRLSLSLYIPALPFLQAEIPKLLRAA